MTEQTQDAPVEVEKSIGILAELLDTLGTKEGGYGMSYEAPTWRGASGARLNLYGKRAKAAYRLLSDGKKFADLLRHAATAALERRVSIPDGWKLVPVELTREMVRAAARCDYSPWQDYIRELWPAMLATAPECPPTDQTQALATTRAEGRAAGLEDLERALSCWNAAVLEGLYELIPDDPDDDMRSLAGIFARRLNHIPDILRNAIRAASKTGRASPDALGEGV